MIEVLGHRLLVKPQELERRTKSGIVIEYGEDERRLRAATQLGEVVQVGPKAWGPPHFDGEPWVQVGDYVVFARYSHKSVLDPDTGIEYFVVNDEDIQCRISKPEIITE